ncbi:MAG: energy-coupling factor transporter transmembrane protein EcfT [Clostridiales bacterium]|nr:energy-coupling factor transporter transmembrane protein EcfT [Clostridiales bacterium]
MNKAREASSAIRSVEELSKQRSPVHDLSPLSKFFLTMVYIVTVASFNKYDLTGLFAMILLPLLGYALSGIQVTLCFRKLKVILPFILLVGIANPFMDREIMYTVGRLHISFGMISMLTLMLKGIYSLMASFLLVSTTPVDELCKSLRKIHVPSMIVSLLLLTYRYVSMFLDEVATMSESYALRAPGQKGIAFGTWGTFLGQLIVRSSYKANRNYESMILRGFKGEFFYCDRRFSGLSWLFILVLTGICVFMRLINLPVLLGSVFVR